MSTKRTRSGAERPLAPGDRVIVASRDEILATLDDGACLDGMPLMPQMLELCGSSQVVDNLADKTCDTINGSGALRLHRTVHLDGVRCDGRAYGGCQAGCLIFWKEAWLKPPGSQPDSHADVPSGDDSRVNENTRASRDEEDARFRCQATELVRASEPLAWYAPGQYWRDWRTNRASLPSLLRAACFFLFRQSLKLGAWRLQVNLFNRWQRLWGGEPFPYRQGQLPKTPSESLDLQPGEVVRVKSHDAILATLDKRNRNRGLAFDAEMVKFCNGLFRVQERVTRIINEQTGVMMEFGTPGIILENVFCTSQVSTRRLFCPRKIHHYWREIWLERVDAPQ